MQYRHYMATVQRPAMAGVHGVCVRHVYQRFEFIFDSALNLPEERFGQAFFSLQPYPEVAYSPYMASSLAIRAQDCA